MQKPNKHQLLKHKAQGIPLSIPKPENIKVIPISQNRPKDKQIRGTCNAMIQKPDK
jgi:hypothetical protein